MAFEDSKIAFERGARFERLALERLRSLGYDAQASNDSNAEDLRVGNVLIEVKGSTRRSMGKRRKKTGFHFTLRRNNGRDRPIIEQVVLLVCDEGEIQFYFVIPGERVQNLTSIRIYGDPAAYGGQWAEYRRAWRLLDLAIARKKSEGVT